MKKLVSIFLSLIMVVSIFSCLGGVAFADESSWIYTGSLEGLPENIPLKSNGYGKAMSVSDGYTNILPEQTLEIKYYASDGTTPTTGSVTSDQGLIYDGILNESDINPSGLNHKDASAPDPQAHLIFKLNSPIIPKYFAYINRSNVARQIVEFDLCVAQTYDDAVSRPTVIAEYSRGDDKTSDHNIIVYDFGEDHEAINYLVVRLKKDTFSEGDWLGGYRIWDIMLLGEEAVEPEESSSWIYNGSVADMTEELPLTIAGTDIGSLISYKDGYRNILSEKKYEIRCHHSDGSQCGSIWKDKEYGIANNHIDNVDIHPEEYWRYPEVDILFKLEGAVTPEYFVMVSRSAANLQIAEFDILGANTYDAAISSPTLLASYSRSSDLSVSEQVNVYKFPEGAETFEYFIVRLKRDNNSENSSYKETYRFNEIVLLGQDPTVNAGEWVYAGGEADIPEEDFPLIKGASMTNGQTLPIKEGYNNLLLGKEYEVCCHHHDDSADCSSINLSNLDKLKTGILADMDINPSGMTTYPEADLIFNLEENVIPEYFLFINRSYVQRQIIEFDVLGANSEEEAKSSPTLLATYSREGDTTSNHRIIAYKFPENSPFYKYLIIRFKKDTFGNAAGYRLSQLALTGRIDDGAGWIHNGSVAEIPEDLPVHISGSAVNSKVTFDEGYENLLKNKDMDVLSYSDNGSKATVWQDHTWHLTANNIIDNVDYDLDADKMSNYIDIIFDMNGSVAPEYFLLINRATINHQTNEYKILGADSYEEARKNPIEIASYKRIQDDVTDQQANVYKFGKNAKSFKYLILRLIDDNYNGPKGYRFTEVVLLGGLTPDGEAKKVRQFEGNLNNILNQKEALTAQKITYCQNEEEGKGTPINGENIQDGNLKSETMIANKFAEYDSSSKEAIWYTDGTRTVEIIYDLGEKFDVSDILIAHHNNYIWRASKYEIYVSKDRETLFQQENLVASVENTVPSQYQVISPMLGKTARYVALKYINPVSTTDIQKVKDGNIYPRIYEFRVYGTAPDCGENHDIVWVERKEPGIFEDGQEAHYACFECDAAFSDAEGKNQIEYDDYKIDPTGYIYHESYEEGENFKLQYLMDFNGQQGAAIYGDYLFSLTSVGKCYVYDIPTGQLISEFKLASYNEGYDSEGKADSRYANHANTANFSTVKFDENDQFPLLYITTGSSGDRDKDNSLISKISVERIIIKDGTWSSECVQLIQYNDYDYLLDEGEENPKKDTGAASGYYLKNNWNGENFKYISGEGYDASKGYEAALSRWFNTIIDFEPNETTSGKMYVTWERFSQDPANLEKYRANYEGFESFEKNNAFIITEFDMPAAPTSETYSGEAETINLTPADITDQSTYSHIDGVMQSGVIYQGILYYVRGNRSKDYPYYMNSMQAIDLSEKKRVGYYKIYETEAYEYEPEALGIWNGELFMMLQTKGFVFDYVALDVEGEEHICSLCKKNMRKHTITFLDKSGNILLQTKAYEGVEIPLEILEQAQALLPNIFGYEKGKEGAYWDGDTSYIAGNTTFNAIYVRKQITAVLTVKDSGDTTTTDFTFDEKVTLQAKDPENFLGWKDSNGAVVSLTSKYSFFMSGDVTLEAVYKTEETTSLERDKVILNAQVHYEENGEDRYNATVTANVMLPVGAVVVEKGVIFTNQKGYEACEGNITMDTNPKQPVSAKRKTSGNYMITLNKIKSGQVRYARAYVTYTLDGERYTEYSKHTATISDTSEGE